MAELPELWKWGEISVSSLLDSAPQEGMGLTLSLRISGSYGVLMVFLRAY